MREAYIENFEQWEKDFTFSTTVKVRFSETDMYGHLNNVVAFTYFEYARIEFMKTTDLFEDPNENSNVLPIVADLQCDYAKQVFFEEVLTIYVKTGAIGRSSVDIHYLIKNEQGEITHTGRGTVVQIDKNTGKGYPLKQSAQN